MFKLGFTLLSEMLSLKIVVGAEFDSIPLKGSKPLVKVTKDRRITCTILWKDTSVNLLSYHSGAASPVGTVWSSELDTLLMRYGVKFTSYRIKSVSNSLDQTVYFALDDLF